MHTRSIVAMVVVLACCGACELALAESKKKVVGKVATFRLRGSLVEMPRGMNLGLFDGQRGTLRSFLDRLDKASKDKEVVGVALLVDEVALGWGQVQELRSGIGRLRGAGKSVHCHVVSTGTGGYMVAAACDRVSMVPSGTLMLTGVSANAIYVKGLLDKLGIKGDMVHCGAYKGAAEPFTRTGPSKESREQMNRVLGDHYAQMVDAIAKSRRLQPRKVKEWIDKGPLKARDAVAAELVDKLSYRDEFLKEIHERFGDAKLARGYGREKGPEIDLASPFAFFSLIKEMMKPSQKRGKNIIALVYVEGMITGGRSGEMLLGDVMTGSDTLRSALLKAAADKSVKGVVLRIDSPGGSALASDVIHRATQVVRRAGKPLVASMGNIAASGGYYVAAGADAIFADPGTLTGSIGVVGGKIVFGGLLDKIGVSTHTYAFGRNADLFSMTRPFDDRERKVVMDLMTNVYDQFKQRVVDGRGKRLEGDIEALAGGRIYTGRQALAKGLVDKLGGLDDAIRFVAARAKLKDYNIRVMPRTKTLFDYLNETFGMGDDEDDVSARVAGGLPPGLAWMKDDATLSGILPTLARLAPEQARALARMLWRIELLGRESALTVTPCELIVR